jgi:hypothetical protein
LSSIRGGTLASVNRRSYILEYLHVLLQRARRCSRGRAGDGGLSMRDLQKDDRVSHSRFGPGVVVAVDARYTTLEFDESGVRKFVRALVQLDRCDLPLPVKRPARRRRSTEARRPR